jgi:predicted KAP-like P-loop ATPase
VATPGPSAPIEGFASDQPIQRAAQDLLGRAPFAGAVARSLARAPRDHGFVVAVPGPWGDGKTSVLNMAIEAFQTQEPQAAVVRFNPWLLSDTLLTSPGELA